MKIYAIAVYDKNSNPIIATAHSNILKADPFKQLIEDTIKPLADEICSQNMYRVLEQSLKDVYKIKIEEGYFYGRLTANQQIILITDTVLTPMKLEQLMKNISAAKASKSTLRSIVRQPEQAATTKIDLIKEELEETLDVARETLEKVLKRGEKIEDLQQKTEDLTKTADTFRKAAKKAREQACWDSLWPYRFYKWMWPPKEQAKPEVKNESSSYFKFR